MQMGMIGLGRATAWLEAQVQVLAPPRVLWLMVPAAAVDRVVQAGG